MGSYTPVLQCAPPSFEYSQLTYCNQSGERLYTQEN